MTRKEAAMVLGVTHTTIKNLIQKKKLRLLPGGVLDPTEVEAEKLKRDKRAFERLHQVSLATLAKVYKEAKGKRWI